MRTPSGLGASGKALWRSVVAGLPNGWELDDRERAVLELACRQRDDVAALERSLSRSGRMVKGSRGQDRLHPAVAELRQARLAIGRLLGQLELPNVEEEKKTAASQRASKAAQTRWDLEARRREGARRAAERRAAGG